MADITTIQIRAETWRELNGRKQPGDTFDDVIQRLLGAETDEPVVEEPSRTREERKAAEPEPSSSVADETDKRIGEIVAAVSASWEDADDKLQARRDAARAALQLAADRGVLSRGDAVDALLPEFSVSGQSEDTWWRKNIRPVLQKVGEHAPGRGYSVDLDED